MTAPDKQALVYEWVLDAPRHKVWRAVSMPDMLAEWIGVPADGDSENGQFRYEVLDASPPNQVRLTWHDDACNTPDMLVTIELSPLSDEKTLFRLTQEPDNTPSVRQLTAANQNGIGLKMAA